MMAVAGAAMVFLTLPSIRHGFSRSLASGETTKTILAGLQLALVGPILARSQTAFKRSSGTSFSSHPLWVRALTKSRSRAR